MSVKDLVTPISTVEKGNTFREHVARVFSAAGWEVEATEYRAGHIKADALCWNVTNSFGSTSRLLVEAKDYNGTLSKDECHKFINNYLPHVGRGTDKYGEAWLVSKGPIAPDAREMVNSNLGLYAMDFVTLQRRLFNVDRLIELAVNEYRREDIDGCFIPPHLVNGNSLRERVINWLEEARAKPLAIIGAYGTGKSTFSLHLAAFLAEQSKHDPCKRVPIRIPLAEVYDEQSMDGLFGKLLASQNRIPNYHFDLFCELNEAGRFVLIFDGFDEMKHGMTIQTFERNVNRLLSLDKGNAKIIILGRDTALHDEHEFRSIIDGVKRTSNGNNVQVEGRRAFEPLLLRDFSVQEAHDFVRRFFPVQAHKVAEGTHPLTEEWISTRITELTSGTLDELLVRPVHARMLCQVATQDSVNLKQLTRFDLYDLFVHHLLDRETRKKVRYDGFDLDCRRYFNGAIAWWLWALGGASTTTLADIPDNLLKESTKGIQHSFAEPELRRELAAGLLVEKREGEVIYFAHRSIQEFLVAEHLIKTKLLQSTGAGAPDLRKILPLMNEVVLDFLNQHLDKDETGVERKEWVALLSRLLGSDITVSWLEVFRRAVTGHEELIETAPAAWQPVLTFLAANGVSDLHIRTNPAAATIELLLDKLAQTKALSVQASILMLAARVAQTTEKVATLVPRLIARCLPAQAIAKVTTEFNNNRAKNYRSHILRDENVPFWTFLRSVGLERQNTGEWYFFIDLRKIEDDMSELAGYSFTRSGTPPAPVTVSEKDVRNFFPSGENGNIIKQFVANAELRKHVSPLIVQTTPNKEKMSLKNHKN